VINFFFLSTGKGNPTCAIYGGCNLLAHADIGGDPRPVLQCDLTAAPPGWRLFKVFFTLA